MFGTFFTSICYSGLSGLPVAMHRHHGRASGYRAKAYARKPRMPFHEMCLIFSVRGEFSPKPGAIPTEIIIPKNARTALAVFGRPSGRALSTMCHLIVVCPSSVTRVLWLNGMLHGVGNGTIG